MDQSTKIMLISMVALALLILVIVLVLNNLKLVKKKDDYKAKYPSSYLTVEGHKVKSLSEMIIDNFFFDNGIKYEYENVIIKSVNKEEKAYKYDWYFPVVDVYVEFFGYSGNKYKANTDNKIKFYRKHNLKLIALSPDDLANFQEQIPEKFGEYWEQVINIKHCPNCGKELDKRV